ncbi:MAG: Asp-tRNA(Asn)/Glu-tRNA(Gln) amidotransferase subunit GatB [bacterium]|nr:Asp-tRNA(Asn)/Glu-tRNA(Gln) amidotransferase subunit GatB [bacterium]MDY2830584.1 Asp-tRNA(Asn)/Glu-tRNA(Gln) amidotransferase subunit GatB [Alphaproteobacteria bacterium]
MIIKGKTADWEVICGLEIHCQIISKSKMFSGASTHYGSDVNENVSFIDAGMPGMLPTLNIQCVRQAIKTGMGLNAKINKYSEFARKNYFYADLPQGYQITQFKYPLVGEGFVKIDLEDGSSKNIGIERIHIEQDAGKSIHDISPTKTFIDLNRAGVGLMEIVTKPDFRSPEEAGAFLRKLRSIVRYLGTCDGNMDEGSMRCDVNVSVRKVGGTEFRTRNEMKNVNSVKFVMQAIESEAKRHVETYENGGVIEQETRQFDPSTGTTKVMRKKEFAHDYRYFPEPDLLPLVLTDEFVEQIRGEMVELPDAKKDRFVKELGLTAYDASVICENKETADFFEKAAHGHEAKKVANWLMGDFFAMLNEKKLTLAESPVSAENLGNLVELVSTNVINGKTAKDVFALMVETGESPEKIVEEKGLRQVTDTSAIEKIVDDILAANPANVAAYKSGKVGLMGWFVGQVMKASQGKANPGVVNQLLSKKLS